MNQVVVFISSSVKRATDSINGMAVFLFMGVTTNTTRKTFQLKLKELKNLDSFSHGTLGARGFFPCCLR